MVIISLNEKLIKSGEKLLKQLDTDNQVVDVALWLYYPELQNWKLVLSFPELIQQGPKIAYEQVQKNMMKISNIVFSLDDVVIAKTDAPIISLLKERINTGPEISNLRFSNNVINGQLIEDAYIYRVTGKNPSIKRKHTTSQSTIR